MTRLATPPHDADEDRIVIQRPLFDDERFNKRFVHAGTVGQSSSRSAWLRFKKSTASLFRCQPLSGSRLSTKLERLFPVIESLRTYDIRLMLLSDIIAGFTAAIMNVPQGMAYGMLAAVGPVEGLYTSFFPPLVYGLFASSRHVSYGTFAVTSMMMASVVTGNLEAVKKLLLAGNGQGSLANVSSFSNSTVFDPALDHHATVHIATASSLACGILMLIACVFRLGCVSSYLSDDLIGGFSAGAAVHIVTSQLKTVFGVQAGNYTGWLSLFKVYRDIIQQAAHINFHTVGLSLICIALLLVVKIYVNGNRRVMRALKNVPVPMELILVGLATMLSFLFYFDRAPHKMQIVGPVPIGLPKPILPRLDVLRLVFNDCISIAIVAFCMTISLGRMFGMKYGYQVSASAELRALGLSNFISSFFSCMPSSGGLTRSLVVANVGGFTQLTTFINCLLLLFVLLFVGPLLSPLPTAVLASIIIAALRPMFVQMGDIKRLLRVSIVDASIWLVTFTTCIFFDVSTGLFAGILYGLFTVVLRFQRPTVSSLGRIRGTELYKPLGEFNECDAPPGVRILRIESPIYFANVEYCRVKLMALSKLYARDDDDVQDENVQRKVSVISVTTSTLANGDFVADNSQTLAGSSSMTSSLDQNETSFAEKREFANEKGPVLNETLPTSCQKKISNLDNGLSTSAMSTSPESSAFHSTTTGDANSNRTTIILPDSCSTPNTEKHSAEEMERCLAIENCQTRKPTKFLVIDCAVMSFIDTSGIALLMGFITACRRADVGVLFASCSNAVRDMLQRSFGPNQRDLFSGTSCWRFVSVHDAVVYASDELLRHGQAQKIYFNKDCVRP